MSVQSVPSLSIVKVVIAALIIISQDLLIYGAEIPPGYFAFEKASRIHGVPPRVRKPPYVPAGVPCPGNYPESNISLKSILGVNCYSQTNLAPFGKGSSTRS